MGGMTEVPDANLSKYLLYYLNHIRIWQVLLQLNCTDTRQR